MIDNLTFSRFVFEIEPCGRITLPDFPGSTFRGGFGHSFKHVVCAFQGKECNDCMLQTSCIYSYVFETPPKDNTEVMRNYNRVPHPFVLEFSPQSKRVCEKGESYFFTAILIGKAIQHIPYFIYAFREMGKLGIGKERGRYVLKNVFSENLTGNRRAIYEKDGSKVETPFKEISGKQLLKNIKNEHDTVKLHFVSPTRIQFNEEITNSFDFHILIRSLLRRISLLSYFHCDEKLEFDFKGIIERAELVKTIASNLEWYDWTRYSNRQKQHMKLGGMVGSIEYKGNLQEFLTLLLCGQYVHVGKNATFGLGGYICEL